MGIPTMGSQGVGQQSHLQPLARQSSWYGLTLDEVEDQLGELGKPLSSMNLDELLRIVWTAEANQAMGMDIDTASSLQHQSSLPLARALSQKTVDEVWRDIQQGESKKNGEEMKGQETEPTLGEITLEDFLVKAGVFADDSLGPVMGLDTVDGVNPLNFPQIGLSSSPSTGTLSDTTTSGRKRDAPENMIEKTIERRLRRKIKNRESAARSRARKQAYHNELVSKVSRLEEENLSLKRDKELEQMLACELSPEPKYQLRRTSSSSF